MNPVDLEHVRALRTRSVRERSKQYFIEGVRFLCSARRAGATFDGLVVCPPLLVSRAGQDAVRELTREGVPCLSVDEATYVELSA